MDFLWLVSGASLLAAIAAWLQARRTAQHLEQLSQMHWELRYQFGELRARLERPASVSDPPPAGDAPAAGRGSQSGRSEPADGFVPLASLKR